MKKRKRPKQKKRYQDVKVKDRYENLTHTLSHALQPHFNFKVEVRLNLKLMLNENEVEGSKLSTSKY